MSDDTPTSPAAPAPFDRRMLEFLVCPMTRGPLVYDAGRQELVSRGAALAYPIHDGIPVMLVDEAEAVDAAEHERIMGRIAAEGIAPTFGAAPGATPA